MITKKRKYTLRKNQIVPQESGSLLHEELKREREVLKRTGNPLYEFVRWRAERKEKK